MLSIMASRPLGGAGAGAKALASCMPIAQGRNMATLRETQMRLKSIKNIGKITKSMKMIASTRLSKAQRNMEAAKIYGQSADHVFEKTQAVAPEGASNALVVISSDRGLCGAIHSSVSKAAKRTLKASPAMPLVVLGDKARSQLSREYRANIVVSFNGLGKELPTFPMAAAIAETITSQPGFKPDVATVIYNQFKSVIAYEAATLRTFSENIISEAPNMTSYEIEDDVLDNLKEFAFASSIYWAMSEGQAAEISARRTAMENATKNANDMVQRLTLKYNRTRQAVITNDLVDIITGASAL